MFIDDSWQPAFADPLLGTQVFAHAAAGPPVGKCCAKCGAPIGSDDNHGWCSVQRVGETGSTVGYLVVYHCGLCPPNEAGAAISKVQTWFPGLTNEWKFPQGDL